jgi:hypothetical protein
MKAKFPFDELGQTLKNDFHSRHLLCSKS